MKPNSMNRFFTREAGNQGTRMPLVDPVTYELTEDWIDILSADSDIFRAAEARAMRESAEAAPTLKTDEEREELSRDKRLQVLASIITGWSFKDDEGNPIPCTHENKVNFLREAPQVYEAVNQAAVTRSLFIKRSSPPSGDTQPPASSLTVVPQDQP
jgi:hypothetical protein